MTTALKFVTTFCLMLSAATAMAGEPKATLCGDIAQKAAEAVFAINVGMTPATKVTPELIDMNHGEGGIEVWDFHFNEGGLDYTPYRISISIDGCIVTGFAMPFAS